MKSDSMRVLVACEESQAVTKELRRLGHEAFSCDLLPCSGGHPEWHLQEDVEGVLRRKWDMILAFPPCTFLTVSGNRWFNVEKYGEKAIQRQADREDAARFFMLLAKADCDRIAIENPVGIMSTRWRKPDQTIQPYEFGDPFEKRTCLWLKGLPPLTGTDHVAPPPRQQVKGGKSLPEWYSNAPKAERAKFRSKTFPGIARAMAEQWAGPPGQKIIL